MVVEHVFAHFYRWQLAHLDFNSDSRNKRLTITMEIRPPTKQQAEADVSYVAHRLPCTIHVDGPLPTARAFCPFPEPMTSFRGRKMESATFEIPPSSQRELQRFCFWVFFVILVSIFERFVQQQD